jgi:hypothetical protein
MRLLYQIGIDLIFLINQKFDYAESHSIAIMPPMFRKGFIAIAFLTNVLLGNLCFMPMVSAAPVSVKEHEEVVMTYLVPMSPVHCKDCLHKVDTGSTHQMNGFSCMSGNCLSGSHAPDTSRILSNSSAHLNDVGFAVASPSVSSSIDFQIPPTLTPLISPLLLTGVHMVVLRQ